MRNIIICTLLAAVIGLLASQASAVQLVYYQPNDTLFLLPGQGAGGEVFVRSDSADRAVFLSLTYNFSSIEFPAQIWGSAPYACGSDESQVTHDGQGSHFHLYWQDRGDLCGINGFHLNTFWFVNQLDPGIDGMLTGQSIATIVSSDTAEPWFDWVSGGFIMPVITYDAIRGNTSGATENDSAFSWQDVEIADSIWRGNDDLGNLYTMHGTNLARGMSYWPQPSPGDVTFMALALQQPNHPYVRNIGYGQLFSTPRNGITQVPATADLQGTTLQISTNGSMVMAIAVLPNGSIWAQSGSTQGGIATFTGVPDGISVEQIVVEAITIDGVSEVDPFQLPALPSQVELGQNYPNPFNPQTTVPFTLQVPANVSLTVFDQLGRQVATLAQGPYQAGRHEVSFNAADLPTGMYFAQLRAGSATSTKKMLLIK